MYWAANCVNDFWLANLQGILEPGDLERIYKEAKKAWRTVKQEAADIGTQAHDHIEGFLNCSLAGVGADIPLPENEQVRNCYLAALDWLAINKVEPIRIERLVCSRKYKFAGKLDLIYKIDGKLAIVDWKSSKALYPEYVLQTAAYQLCYEEETGEKIDTRWLVRLGKDDGAFEAKERPRKFYPTDKRAFLSALNLFRYLNA